ncbi:phage tail assembly chaperone G [Rossellomorea marisflavi]|uniref:phage tail assembly chaperone G n=1 Tax=Rossellomorea marisflavi TaxID=189381 RepID=UPI0039BF80B3
MPKLLRNTIRLVKEVKEEEVIFETYYTPPFIPFDVVYEATDMSQAMQEGTKSERELMDDLVVFVSDRIYEGKFSAQELKSGLHAPEAMRILQEQVQFVAQGDQTDETKKFLMEKNL